MHGVDWFVVAKVIKVVLLLLVVAWALRQCRKPTGWFGKRLLRGFNVSHGKMTDWGLEHVRVKSDAMILDVGCGGGLTVQKLARMATQGEVTGLDYSPTCVEVARETNSQEIEAGRVQVEQGSVAALPFPDGHFDLVTAIETHYYWPDLPANVREILRVLKPGGSFLLIAETYRGGPLRLLYSLIMPLLRAKLLSDEEHRELLTQVGFVDVATYHQKGKNWIAATGRRPQ